MPSGATLVSVGLLRVISVSPPFMFSRPRCAVCCSAASPGCSRRSRGIPGLLAGWRQLAVDVIDRAADFAFQAELVIADREVVTFAGFVAAAELLPFERVRIRMAGDFDIRLGENRRAIGSSIGDSGANRPLPAVSPSMMEIVDGRRYLRNT